MIVVPRIDQSQIAPTLGPAPSSGQQVSPAAGMELGQAISGLGEKFAQIQQQEQAKANVAALNQARIALANKEASYFDPNNQQGIYSYKGIDALNAPGAFGSDLADFADKYRQGLANPDQQQAFDSLYAEHRLGLLDRINSYAHDQKTQYEQQSFEGAVGSALSSATTKAQAGDADGALQAQLDGVNAIKQFGQANGWAPEQTQYSVDKFNASVRAANDAANKANVEQYILQNPQGALSDLSAKLGIGQYSAASQAVSGDTNAPRGIRNNNPGNIRKSDLAWQGKVASPDPAYEAFATPEAGIRALALNAQHLQDKGGAQTVGQLIAMWAPRNENDTQAYIADVSKQVGVAPDAPIDLHDPQQLTALTGAIISHENGGNPYSADQVQAGVQAAMGKGKLAASHPPVTMNGSGMIVPADGSAPVAQTRQTGNFQIDALQTGDAVELYNRAREEVNRNNVNMRASVEQRVRDDTAAFKNGQPVKQPLSEAEFTQAYGDKDGMTLYGEYASNQQLGKDLRTVATLTPQQMQDLATARAPQAGEGYAVKAADQSILMGAMQQTIQARQKDPVLWATTSGVGGIQQLDLTSPDKLASSIAARGAAMQTVSQSYQTPYRLLSATERSALSSTINGMPMKDKAVFLGALSTKLSPNDYQQVISDIKANSPVTAVAGQIMGAGHAAQVGTTGSLWWKQPTMMSAQDVAETMLAGDALINPTKADKDANGTPKFAMPSDNPTTGLRSTWSDTVGDAFRGDGQSEMQSYQAYRAMYAGLASKAGISDGTLNTDIAQEAARAVLGNVVEWNGHNVIPPYGMDENAFTDAANAQWARIRSETSSASEDDIKAYNLDPVPGRPGLYAVTSGINPVRWKNGTPVAIRITPPHEPIFASQPGAPQPPAPTKPAEQPPPQTAKSQSFSGDIFSSIFGDKTSNQTLGDLITGGK